MLVYLLSFGSVRRKKGSEAEEGGKVNKREKGCHAGHYGSNFLTFYLIRQ